MSYWGGGGTLNPASVWYRLPRFIKNVVFLIYFFQNSCLIEGGTLSPDSLWYRLARFKKLRKCFFETHFISKLMSYWGGTLSPGIVSYRLAEFKNLKKNYSILFQNSCHIERGTLSPDSVWYRLARLNFKFIYFKIHVILRGGHSTQRVYDIG